MKMDVILIDKLKLLAGLVSLQERVMQNACQFADIKKQLDLKSVTMALLGVVMTVRVSLLAGPAQGETVQRPQYAHLSVGMDFQRGIETCDDGTQDDVGCDSSCTGFFTDYSCTQYSSEEPAICCTSYSSSSSGLKLCANEQSVNFTMAMKNNSKTFITTILITQAVVGTIGSMSTII